jgi:hypothetical protein
MDRLKKRRQGNKKRKNLNTTNYSDFSDESHDRIRKQVLATMDASTSRADPVVAITKATSPGHHVFVADVFAVSSSSKTTLPVQINSLFPHITLQLGVAADASENPHIRCVIDTAAALTTGNFNFFASIANAFHTPSGKCMFQPIMLPSSYPELFSATMTN